MNNEWAFLPMRSSNDLLGEPAALRQRLDEDSYLYFEQVIAPEKIHVLRQRMLSTLADHGWVADGPLLDHALAVSEVTHEGMGTFAPCYDAVQRLEEFHTLAHDDELTAVMRQVVGETAFPHPLKIARLSFPTAFEVSTPPHQDFPNNQGTDRLLASWIPVGDISTELGGLAILRGSHHYGVLPLTVHPGPGNRQAVLPTEMLEKLHWVTTDYRSGDVLLFPSLAVHSSLHNASEVSMRLSVDFRWQQEGEALTEGCLEPHFRRLTWDQIYEGWSSREHQYYWRGLDYEVTPFVEMLEPEWDNKTGTHIEAAISDRERAGAPVFDEAQWAEIVRVGQRQRARFARRMAMVSKLKGEGGGDL